MICKEKIAKHGLEMKLVNAEYTFDSNKLLFYFTADGRIDFRELVKDLASVFRTRIELRQIGVRDETKILGGIGICGRELCCKSYLADFIPVSIKMAKEQNLSLNPTKISGVCGRLMCCLKNEQETYEYLNSRLPSVGDTVMTPAGMRGNVQSVNVLRQLVKVIVDNGEEKELQEYRVDDLKFTPRRRRDVKLTEEELKELKELEDDGESVSAKNESGSRENREGRGNGKNRSSRRGRGERDGRENTNGQNGRGDDSGKREYGRRNRHGDKNQQGQESVSDLTQNSENGQENMSNDVKNNRQNGAADDA